MLGFLVAAEISTKHLLGQVLVESPVAVMHYRHNHFLPTAEQIALMKKLKDEKELLKKAIADGVKYGEQRGVVEFEATDSANEKIEYIYRLLVHDNVIQPLPEEQVSQKSMRHKLALWASKNQSK